MVEPSLSRHPQPDPDSTRFAGFQAGWRRIGLIDPGEVQGASPQRRDCARRHGSAKVAA